ncbi:MAG: GNAT family N-acetyltransferase [Abyssibacter sp.]|jgi:GNAT superfamily N-acetyltransferase|uniref:GNAT family N-acetyltransferase n=1 Tax=Abyssibacter sp. TaxID=2320200 RepID=UPI00321B12BD
MSPLPVVRVSIAQVLPVRHQLLRAHQPLARAQFAGDDSPEVGHFAAMRDGGIVGVVSIFPESDPRCTRAPADQQWRIRGMATAPEVQGQGLGAALLQAAVDYALLGDARAIWCNARQPAIGFYARYGFAGSGPIFDIDGIGPHQYMERPA